MVLKYDEFLAFGKAFEKFVLRTKAYVYNGFSFQQCLKGFTWGQNMDLEKTFDRLYNNISLAKVVTDNTMTDLAKAFKSKTIWRKFDI